MSPFYTLSVYTEVMIAASGEHNNSKLTHGLMISVRTRKTKELKVGF